MVIQTSTNVCKLYSTYIFSADITPEMLKLCRATKVKLFFLVLVYVFNFNQFWLIWIFGRRFEEGSIINYLNFHATHTSMLYLARPRMKGRSWFQGLLAEVVFSYGTRPLVVSRELKNPRRRRRGQRRLKNELIFYLRISRYPKVIYFVYLCQSYHETESRTHQWIRNKNSKN